VSFHLSGLWPESGVPLIGLGYLGVDLFFILSGFVLALVHGEAFRRDPLTAYPDFLTRRIARIFPAWLFVLALFALKHRSFDLADLAVYGVLAQAWTGEASQLVNPPGWSVSLEWAGYLLFPLLAFLPLRADTGRAALIGIVLMLAMVAAGYALAGGSSLYDAERLYGLRFVGEFVIGVLLWRQTGVLPARQRLHDVVASAVLAVIVVIAFVVPPGGRRLAVDLAVVGLFTIFLGSLVHAEGPLSRMLSSTPLRWLGERSYSLYVVHWLVLETLWIRAGAVLPKALAALVMAAVSIVVGAAIYAGVEAPARRYLRRRLG
jgi:peptidoglycan/LPS O-acetylase OafA/YrhL